VPVEQMPAPPLLALRRLLAEGYQAGERALARVPLLRHQRVVLLRLVQRQDVRGREVAAAGRRGAPVRVRFQVVPLEGAGGGERQGRVRREQALDWRGGGGWRRFRGRRRRARWAGDGEVERRVYFDISGRWSRSWEEEADRVRLDMLEIGIEF